MDGLAIGINPEVAVPAKTSWCGGLPSTAARVGCVAVHPDWTRADAAAVAEKHAAVRAKLTERQITRHVQDVASASVGVSNLFGELTAQARPNQPDRLISRVLKHGW